ncbi:MAG: NAD(P)H-dependent oxidoreductase [Bacteriovorax sp.]|nr:NAD(P)H-dependent oxidoreductase [Bacteriovorax sp.]
MKILLFAGSLRKDSLNKKVVRFTDKLLKSNLDLKTTVVDLQTLNIPVYDGDIETAGIPEGVKTLAALVASANAIIISSPEYNGSMSSPLKNTLDWLSRVKPLPITKKPILMLGASPGALGATRGLAHARWPLETLGNFLYPEAMGFMHADQAFDENEDLKDPVQLAKLQKLINSFIEYAGKLK